MPEEFGKEYEMVDKRRLYLMIAMARFKDKKTDSSVRISNYHQRDYIAMKLIVNFLVTTVAYILLLAFYAMYNLEDILSNLNVMNFRPILAVIIVFYLVFLGVYTVIAFTRARIQYVRADADVEQYENALDRMNRMYREEDRLSETDDEDDYDYFDDDDED